MIECWLSPPETWLLLNHIIIYRVTASTPGREKNTSVLFEKDDEAHEAAEEESYTSPFQSVRDTLFAIY